MGRVPGALALLARWTHARWIARCAVLAACVIARPSLTAAAVPTADSASSRAAAPAAAEPLPALRVATYNILHSGVRSPVGSWSTRRARVVGIIRMARPDVAGLQEVSDRQLADLTLDLPEYQIVPGPRSGRAVFPLWALLAAATLSAVWLALRLGARRSHQRTFLRRRLEGVFRGGALFMLLCFVVARVFLGDFLDSGERCPILVRKERLSCVETGAFWISSHPERPGSLLPGNPTPHIVNWARLVDRASADTCLFYSTHLGLVPWTARAVAGVIASRLDREPPGTEQILVGDFNSRPDGPLVRALLAGPDSRRAWHDAWTGAARREGAGGTFHWPGQKETRIDYVLTRPALEVPYASLTDTRPGRPHASDHCLLSAKLRPRTGSPR